MDKKVILFIAPHLSTGGMPQYLYKQIECLVDVFDVYAGKNIEEGKKSIAFNMMFNSEERTLQEAEIESVINNVIKSVEKDFKATLRNF